MYKVVEKEHTTNTSVDAYDALRGGQGMVDGVIASCSNSGNCSLLFM